MLDPLRVLDPLYVMVLLGGNLIAGIPIARAARLRGHSFPLWLLLTVIASAPIALFFLVRQPNRKFLRQREYERAIIDQELAHVAPPHPAAKFESAMGTIGDAQTID